MVRDWNLGWDQKYKTRLQKAGLREFLTESQKFFRNPGN
jgi:hypothetical protein